MTELHVLSLLLLGLIAAILIIQALHQIYQRACWCLDWLRNKPGDDL